MADLKSGDRKRSLYRAPSISVGRYIALSGAKRAHTPGQETLLTPVGPDNSTAVIWWKSLGEVAGDGGEQVKNQESYISHGAEG